MTLLDEVSSECAVTAAPETVVASVAHQPRAWRRAWPLALPILLALVVRAYQLSRPGYLFGVTTWDDGAYLGQVLRLLDGVMPYRDYPMVEPPGLTLILAPVVEVFRSFGTDTAFAAVRVLTSAVDVINVVLVGAALRHRGRVAIGVAMTGMALYPGGLASDFSLFLEPYLNLFCLLGVLFIFQRGDLAGGRRLLVGGAFLGVAGSIKIFAVFPVLGLALVFGRRERRSLGRIITGAALGFGGFSLPLAVLGPVAFMRGAICSEIFRSEPRSVATGYRLRELVGLTDFPLTPATGLVIGTATLAIVFLVLWRRRGELRPLEKVSAATSLLIVGSVLFVSVFQGHYTAFLAPFLFTAIGGLLSRAGPSARRRVLPFAVASVFACLVLLSEIISISSATAVSEPGVLRVPASACVLSDSPANLIVDDAFRTTPGCPVFVDTFGATMAWTGGKTPAAVERSGNTADMVHWEQLFGRADYLVWTDWHTVDMPVTPTFLRWLHQSFVPVGPLPGGGGELYKHR
jgi:alpha-1,2-mannosyltransferase